MKKIYLILPATVLLTGCAAMQSDSSFINDPNIPAILDSVGVVGTVVGGSIGGLILIGTNITSAAWGVWQRNHKKQSESKYSTLEKVTATVVQTIDEVSNLTLSDNSTIGDTVKAKVKAKLQNNDTYQAGKAIISGLKA